MAKPKLLILDEPCAGLDPVARRHFLDFLERLTRHARSPSLVLVTHHIEEITPGFSHSLLLRKGEVVAAAPLARALTSRTLSVAFDAPLRVTRREGTLRLALPSLAHQHPIL
jgi:iron complex transport system ATP-binding protein